MEGKKKAVITTAMFLTVVFGLSVVNWLTPQKEFSENENRSLQQLPEWSAETFFNGKYGETFETFTTDQFVGRDQWVAVKTTADLAVQKKDSGGIYFAEDGYLIEKYTQQDVPTEQFLKNTVRVKQFLEDSLSVLGEGHAKAMIVPTASQVLNDYLPAFAPSADQEQMLQQLEQQLPEGTFINLLPVLEQQKQEHQLYYRTDHHWTTYGAFLGYQTWAEQIGITPYQEEDFSVQTVSDSFYGTTYSKANISWVNPDSIETYVPTWEYPVTLEINNGQKVRTLDGFYDDSYLSKKDKYSYFLGGNNPLVKIHTQTQNGKKLLIIKDSYAHCFAPFAALHFEEVDLIDLRYFRMSLKDYIAENGITDVLVLYNMQGFADDRNMATIVK